MLRSIRFLTLTLVFAAINVAFSGCDRAPPPAENPIKESLEDFLSRKVRSAKIKLLSDRGNGDSFSASGPNPLTFRWTFGKHDFGIVSTDDAVPKLITEMLFGNEQKVKQIRGTWSLEMREGAHGLLLQDLETDSGTTKSAVPLNLYHTSPAVIIVSGDTDAELMFQVDSDPGNL